MPGPVIFEAIGKPLVVAHALCAFSAAAVSVHLALHARSVARRRGGHKRGRVFAKTTGILFAATVLTGLLAYPNFRYHVRGLYLDHHFPWASNLFDMKENLALLILPFMALALWTDASSAKDDTAAAKKTFAWSTAVTAAVLAACVVMGLVITLVKGV
ncbi:MAG: hypothetical protein M5R36_05180 [Deltaproteobacteria bacterium]|nr:hypothetical protein [Deltaproteobacteria bacterium]